MTKKRLHVAGGGRKVSKKELGAVLFPVPAETGLVPVYPKEPTEEERRGKFKRSAHLTDVTLGYKKKGSGEQLEIFDMLTPETKEKILQAGVSLELVNRQGDGIALTKGEYKVIDCLTELLYDTSQTTDPTDKTYYTGNKEIQLADYGGSGRKAVAPKIAVTLYELTKKYKGGGAVSGNDVRHVRRILIGLADDPLKKVLIRYSRELKTPKGRAVETIEDYQHLVRILGLSRTEYGNGNAVTSQREEVVIVLNPIFRDQIQGKYILFPKGITKQMIEAAGTHNIPEATYRLRDWLARAHSTKNYTPEIGLEKLYWRVAGEYMKDSRRKLARDYTERAIEAVTKLGLLQSYKRETGRGGEVKIVFTLNKDW